MHYGDIEGKWSAKEGGYDGERVLRYYKECVCVCLRVSVCLRRRPRTFSCFLPPRWMVMHSGARASRGLEVRASLSTSLPDPEGKKEDGASAAAHPAATLFFSPMFHTMPNATLALLHHACKLFHAGVK